MCGSTIRARSLDGYSHQVIRDRYTMPLACTRRFCIHIVGYVPVCAGVRFCARSLDGCSRQVIQGRCTVSLETVAAFVYARCVVCGKLR